MVRVLPGLVAVALSVVLLAVLIPAFGGLPAGIAVGALCVLAVPLQLSMAVVPPDELRFTDTGILVRRTFRHDLPVPWEVVRAVRAVRRLGLPVVVVTVDSASSSRIVAIPLGTGLCTRAVRATVRQLAPPAVAVA